MCYSDLAAPLDASIFLMNSKGLDCLKSGPRYISADEFNSDERVPDARSRFVYNDHAHRCAKIIAKLFAANLKIRRNSVGIIEKYYQFYRARKKYRIMYQERITAAMVLQFTYRKKVAFIRRKKAK